MAQNGQVTHEADLDMNRDMALRNGTVTDVPESRSRSLATGSPISSADKLHRDSTPSLGTSDEADKDPTPPGVRFTCTRASPSPSPDLLGNQHPQAEPGSEIMRHESVPDDTKAAPESRGDPMEDGSDVTTTQSVQINHLSVGEAGLDNDERAGLTEEGQVPASLRFRQRTRSVKQSKVPMTSTRCLRPRPNATSTQRLPAVSVVIPARRADELGASTKMTPPTTARRYVEWGDSDGDINNAGPTPAARGEYSPSSGVSSPQARGRPQKRPKRAMETISSSTNDITRKCTSQAPNPLDGGFAVALGKTQEIFGRGVLRIQSHGPRHAYFMTFLPEVTDRPSMVSASEMSPDQPSHPDNFSENASSRQGMRGRPGSQRIRNGTRDLGLIAARPNENPVGACGGPLER
ncbi:hypothetical protein N7523_008386 [Penicillium sp. IBT 18751x]|nr:hypothetical protein N7523_008386 [Penicillium sp. IBT 18751x]